MQSWFFIITALHHLILFRQKPSRECVWNQGWYNIVVRSVKFFLIIVFIPDFVCFWYLLTICANVSSRRMGLWHCKVFEMSHCHIDTFQQICSHQWSAVALTQPFSTDPVLPTCRTLYCGAFILAISSAPALLLADCPHPCPCCLSGMGETAGTTKVRKLVGQDKDSS